MTLRPLRHWTYLLYLFIYIYFIIFIILLMRVRLSCLAATIIYLYTALINKSVGM